MAEIRKMMRVVMIPILIAAIALPACAHNKRRRGHHMNHMIRVSSEQFCSVPGAYASIGIRDTELRAQIISELQAGRLTPTQATDLMSMLAEIKEAQRDYQHGSGGVLSLPQVNALRVALNSVSKQLHSSTDSPLTLLNPSGVGFALPDMGYPAGLNLKCSAAKRIGSVVPWWMM